MEFDPRTVQPVASRYRLRYPAYWVQRILEKFRFSPQKGDMKHVEYGELKILEWPLNLTVIWRSLLGARELIRTFVCKERNCHNFTQNNGRPSDQPPLICAPRFRLPFRVIRGGSNSLIANAVELRPGTENLFMPGKITVH
jgi:hypothetical protein